MALIWKLIDVADADRSPAGPMEARRIDQTGLAWADGSW